MPVPIEVVVVRAPLPAPVLAVIPKPPRAAPAAPPPDAPPEFSPEQLRERDALLEALHCHVRERILWTLCAAGRANVALLTRRTGIDPKKLSGHLGKLKDLGLLFSRREGKEIWYEPAAGRVRYERHADDTGTGETFSLTITARGGGVSVTVTVTVGGKGVSGGAP